MISGIAAGEDDFQVGTVLAKFLGEFKAASAGQNEVRNQQTDGVGVLRPDGAGFGGIAGGQNFVFRALEKGGQERADGIFIFNDKYGDSLTGAFVRRRTH